jgi:hypothetical protein
MKDLVILATYAWSCKTSYGKEWYNWLRDEWYNWLGKDWYTIAGFGRRSIIACGKSGRRIYFTSYVL